MTLPIGTHVVVRTLGSKRGVVIEADRNGRYHVRVERITIWCREEDLAVPTEGKKKKRTAPTSQNRPTEPMAEKAAPARRVDLHGLSVEEAIARVIDEIDRALRDGADRVEVVHGKGAGRIRNALHHQLASLPVVAAFSLDPHNPGVTWVYFR